MDTPWPKSPIVNPCRLLFIANHCISGLKPKKITGFPDGRLIVDAISVGHLLSHHSGDTNIMVANV
jgi:hypothetical protein